MVTRSKTPQVVANEATDGTQFDARVVKHDRLRVLSAVNYQGHLVHAIEAITFRVVREAVGFPLVGSWAMEVQIIIREDDPSEVLEGRVTEAILAAMRMMDSITKWGRGDFRPLDGV